MENLEQFLAREGAWVLERLSALGATEADRNYYQGRIDQIAQIRSVLGHKSILIEREKASQ